MRACLTSRRTNGNPSPPLTATFLSRALLLKQLSTPLPAFMSAIPSFDGETNVLTAGAATSIDALRTALAAAAAASPPAAPMALALERHLGRVASTQVSLEDPVETALLLAGHVIMLSWFRECSPSRAACHASADLSNSLIALPTGPVCRVVGGKPCTCTVAPSASIRHRHAFGGLPCSAPPLAAHCHSCSPCRFLPLGWGPRIDSPILPE